MCVPFNTVVNPRAVDIIVYGSGNEPTGNLNKDIVYQLNDQETFVPNTPIITDYTYLDSVDTIYDKTRKKHFCEQFSLIYKNDNLILQSQPWSVFGIATSFCDQYMLNSKSDINIFGSTFFRYYQPNGKPVPVQLEGLPDGWTAFGDGVNPNYNTPDGACTAAVGVNVEELRLQDECVQQLKVNRGDIDAQYEVSSNDILGIWKEQEVNVNQFSSDSGIDPLDPLDPNYEEKLMERERTNAMLGLDTDVINTPSDELNNVTETFRYNFTEPPLDGTPQQNNPGAPFPFVPKSKQGTGRFILSIDPVTKKVPAPKYTSEFLRELVKVMPSSITSKLNTVMSYATVSSPSQSMSKHERAHAYKLKKRIIRFGEELHEKVYERYRRAYASQGYDVDKDVDYLVKTRKLMMTGDARIDKQINEILDMFSDVPHNPLSLSRQQFYTFLEKDIANRMVKIASIARTIIMPRIFNAIFSFANADFQSNLNTTYFFQNITAYANQVFGETQNPSNCKNTMQDPYRCCGAATTPYGCCIGLVGCVQDVPPSAYPTQTTAENVDRWYCTNVDSFFEWWYWAIRLGVSIFTSLTVSTFTSLNQDPSLPLYGNLILHSLPDNLLSCMAVNLPYLFWGIDIVFAVYLFFSVQIFTLLAITVNNYRNEIGRAHV